MRATSYKGWLLVLCLAVALSAVVAPGSSLAQQAGKAPSGGAGDTGPSIDGKVLIPHYENSGQVVQTDQTFVTSGPSGPGQPSHHHVVPRGSIFKAHSFRHRTSPTWIPDLGACGTDAWAQEMAAGLTGR